VAALICWLCSEEASFSTGAVLDCSGGRATYRSRRRLRLIQINARVCSAR
jgi:hypothetical protein